MSAYLRPGELGGRDNLGLKQEYGAHEGNMQEGVSVNQGSRDALAALETSHLSMPKITYP
jgi:hypothetical protein